MVPGAQQTRADLDAVVARVLADVLARAVRADLAREAEDTARGSIRVTRYTIAPGLARRARVLERDDARA